MSEGAEGAVEPAARPRVRLGAIIAVAIGVGFLVWLATGKKSNPSAVATTAAIATTTTATTTTTGRGPTAITPSELAALASSLGQPIYWYGPKPGYTYELTRTANGSIYVRYLPPGVKVGDPSDKYLIVATYPFPNALQSLEGIANGKGVAIPGGGLALVDASYPRSVHLAYPGVTFQVEVYGDDPSASLAIAKSGDVKPVS